MANVLIVDDDVSAQKAMKQSLYEGGIKSAHTASSDAAYSILFVEGEFDALVLNVGLEDRTGLELFGKIRDSFPSLPVVMLASGGGVFSVEVAAAIADLRGAKSFLLKPFSGADLVASVKRALKSD
ncbi:response regulator [Falsihalocynthiibacter sp. SS001]|uniref:response regulator n=1 Tax=Falsihalocynthiibacter sp. SS001 TaxID=3349698 RepID=UPI0036D260E5